MRGGWGGGVRCPLESTGSRRAGSPREDIYVPLLRSQSLGEVHEFRARGLGITKASPRDLGPLRETSCALEEPLDLFPRTAGWVERQLNLARFAARPVDGHELGDSASGARGFDHE